MILHPVALHLLPFTPGLLSGHNTCHWALIVSSRETRTAISVSSEVGLQSLKLPYSESGSLICKSSDKSRLKQLTL